MAINRFSQSTAQSAFPKFTNFWDGSSAVGSMDAITSITLTASQYTVVFNSIPQTYTHLHLRGVSRSTEAGASDVTLLGQFNSDTGSNYSYHRMYGYGSTANNDSSASGSSVALGSVLTDGNTASTYTSCIVDIVDYTSSVKHKTTRSYSGFDNNSNGSIHFASGNWRASSITGITSILLKPSGGFFTAGTRFSLYGIK